MACVDSRMSLISRVCVVGVAGVICPTAVSQVQLQFVFPPANTSPVKYGLVVPMANGDRLLVGSGPGITLTALGSPGFTPLRTLGGQGNDAPQAAAVDPNGNIWIVGNTNSDDFLLMNPIVPQKTRYAPTGFVMELDPTGKLLFSTFLDSAGLTSASAVALDGAGNAYVGGTVGNSTAAIANRYSYLMKISPGGQLVYSTQLLTGPPCMGGSSCIGAFGSSGSVTGLFVDATGAATVGGLLTGGWSFFSGQRSLQPYVLRLAPNGSKLWSTPQDIGLPLGMTPSYFIAPDLRPDPTGGPPLLTGNVDVFGVSSGGSGLGTPRLFAAQLNTDGSMGWSADLSSSGDAKAYGIVSDSSGNAYLAGVSGGSDFVMTLDSSGTPLRTLHLPRGSITAAPALDVGDGPALLLLGSQGSLLTVPVDYNFDSPALVGFANSASFALNTGLYPGALVTLFGFDLPATAQILINGKSSPVLFAGPTQINLQVPFETPLSNYYNSAQLELVSPSGTISLQVPLSQSIGLFTTDGVHAASLNQDGTVNSADNPAVAGSVVSLFGTGAMWPAGMQDGAEAGSAMPLDQEQNRFEALDWNQAPLNLFYAGAAPGSINGVFQVNVQLPQVQPPRQGVAPTVTLRSTPIFEAISSNPVQLYIK